MKRIIFLVLLSMAFATVNAQRVDLDKEHFKHRYRRWPNKVLDSSYSTYSVNVKQTATIEKYFKNDPAAAIAIAGRESVATDGHIQVSVNLGDVIVESSGIRNREEVNKDKDGKETGRRKYYWIELVYRFSADVKVTGYKGEELEAYELESKENKETWRSSEYQSYSEAAKYYDNNKLAIRSDFITKKITSELNDLNASLNANYGFTAIAASEILWKLGSKKHPEYDQYNDAVARTRSELEKMTANEMPAGIDDALQPSIAYFESLPGKYADPNDKGAKKLRYSAYYNLASIYFYLEQFEKANFYATKLIGNEFDTKDGVKFQEAIQNVKMVLAKHAADSRHFTPPWLSHN